MRAQDAVLQAVAAGRGAPAGPAMPNVPAGRPAESAQANPAPAAASAAPSQPGQTILLVDDDSAVREGLRRVLATEGWHVIAADSGAEALERMREREPDLVITDACMVPLRVWLMLIRERLRRPDLPILVITALSRQATGGATLHATEIFQKPLDLDALLAAVRVHLGPDARAVRGTPLLAPPEMPPPFGLQGPDLA